MAMKHTNLMNVPRPMDNSSEHNSFHSSDPHSYSLAKDKTLVPHSIL